MEDAGARFVASSIAAFVAETVTLPTDVVKTRLQVQKKDPVTGKYPYNGMADCIRKTIKAEGAPALWKGLAPALVRQISYTSLSLVLYEPIRDFIVTPAELDMGIPFWKRLLAGGTAGGIAISVFNPTEVVKTQMQTASGSTSMLQVAKHVWNHNGLVGFWAGVYPNVVRTFLVQAAEIGVYDHAKHMVAPYVGENFFAHVTASAIAGFASASTSTPADVVKTRLMNSAGNDGPRLGMLGTARKIVQTEGLGALYSGFLPILVRKVVWVTAFFVTFEQLRPMFS